MAYQCQWNVTAGDTDFSGRIYTPAVIDCFCRTVEQILDAENITVHDELAQQGFTAPVVHAEADYLSNFGVGDTIGVEMTISTGNSSFIFECSGVNDGQPVFDGELVMVLVDRNTGEKTEIPDWIRNPLLKYEPA